MRKGQVWMHSAEGLYRYQPTGIYFARIRFGGKLYRRSLETSDKTLAKRKLADFKKQLGNTDASAGKTTFDAVLKTFEAKLGVLAPGTQKTSGRSSRSCGKPFSVSTLSRCGASGPAMLRDGSLGTARAGASPITTIA